MTRRDLFLRSRALGALFLASLAAPPLSYWWRSSRGTGDQDAAASWVDLGSARKLPEGEWLSRKFVLPRFNRWRLDMTEQMVYVYREERRITVVSAVCPHAACLVRPRDDGFACPCHKSAFDAEGKPLGGPAPRSLDRLEWKVEKGRLKVNYQEFRPGVADSEVLQA